MYCGTYDDGCREMQHVLGKEAPIASVHEGEENAANATNASNEDNSKQTLGANRSSINIG